MTRSRFNAALAQTIALCALVAQVPGHAAPQDASGAPAAADVAGKVMTVLGPLDASELGTTITHEHIFIDFTLPEDQPLRWQWAQRRRPSTAAEIELWNRPVTMDILFELNGEFGRNRDDLLLTDERTAIDELLVFKNLGGRSVVDVTSIGLKRDPLALRRVAQATGLNIVMGSSWYVRAWHPADMDTRTIASLTGEIVRDLTEGVGDTGVRAGIIGEVGAADSASHPLSANEIKVLRASARASLLTGAAISLHTEGVQPPRVLDLLAQEGADLGRVIVGHAHYFATDLDYVMQVARRGAYIQFDLLGLYGEVWSPDNDRVAALAIQKLLAAGYGERILLSHDVCSKHQLRKYGGNGYGFVLAQFTAYLRSVGVSEAQIETMLVANPARVLALVEPRGGAKDQAGTSGAQ